MAYNRPALIEIIERKISEVDSRLPNAVARLKNSVINALVRSSSGTAHGLYGFVDWMSQQVIADSAEAELLDRHASWWKKTRNAATKTIGPIDVVGNGTIAAGTVLQRADDVEYTVDSEVTITGTGSVSVTATVEGIAANADSGTPLTLTSAIAGINSTATVSAAGLTNGSDIESDDALRARLRERVQQTPHGGAKHDYIAWAKEISGITRAWSFPLWLGDGTVAVFVVRDDDADFIPDLAELAEVQAHIDLVRPVTASVTVVAPINVAQGLTISINPNTSITQAAITAELQDLFTREAEVEDGNGSGTLLISHVREAISIAAGEFDHALVSPVADIELTSGQISSLGSITWSSL
ncbi:MAG: baseplate J/gp47 family protein [Gammaproteobacteria bacterium]|nr:baseplate J/gp47 family protein [Gammaproteobacteria bacterium]